jgi:hypothetical protein
MAIASVFGSCELFHGPPDQNIYPYQFAPSNPHLEQSGYSFPNMRVVSNKVNKRIQAMINIKD